MLPALLRFRALDFVLWHGRRALVVVAGLAMAQLRVAHQTTTMTDAVVLPAEIPSAITTFAYCFQHGSFLQFTGSDSIFRLVIETAYALAEA